MRPNGPALPLKSRGTGKWRFTPWRLRRSLTAANSRRHVDRCADVSVDHIILGVPSRGEIVDGHFRLSVGAEGAITPVMNIPKYAILKFSWKKPYAIVRTPHFKIDAAMTMLALIGVAGLMRARCPSMVWFSLMLLTLANQGRSRNDSCTSAEEAAGRRMRR